MDERKRELMRDLDSYLTVRLRKRKNDEDSFYSFKKKKVEVVDDTLPQVETLDDEYEEKGPGFWKSFWYGIVGEPENKDVTEELKEEVKDVKQEEVHVKEDVCALAKISLEMLRQTPNKWLKEFKQTEDFAKYKEILRRHDVIK